MRYPGTVEFTAKIESFMQSDIPELWNKLLHFFILMDMNGRPIYTQNPYLAERFNATIPGIQQALLKLENMKFIKRSYFRNNKRTIKLNRGAVVPFLRQYDLSDSFYSDLKNWSLERRFIRKKIITIVDFIRGIKNNKSILFKHYVEYQVAAYNYDEVIITQSSGLISLEEHRIILDQQLDEFEKLRALERIGFNLGLAPVR